MRNLFRFIGVMAVMALCIALSACSGLTTASPAPTVTVTATSVVTATVTESPTPSPAASATYTAPSYSQAALDAANAYLESPERAARYNSVIPKAGALIAQGLQDGQFGPVKRYDSAKQDLQTGYVGWGGIAALNKEAFAWVYWNADGSIDLSEPITQISLETSGSPATDISAFGPVSEYDHWTVSKAVGDKYRMASYTSSVYGDLRSPDENGGYLYPYSIEEFAQLDDDVLKQLDANMTDHFGTNWNG